jgi:hypothetical protein
MQAVAEPVHLGRILEREALQQLKGGTRQDLAAMGDGRLCLGLAARRKWP